MIILFWRWNILFGKKAWQINARSNISCRQVIEKKILFFNRSMVFGNWYILCKLFRTDYDTRIIEY